MDKSKIFRKLKFLSKLFLNVLKHFHYSNHLLHFLSKCNEELTFSALTWNLISLMSFFMANYSFYRYLFIHLEPRVVECKRKHHFQQCLLVYQDLWIWQIKIYKLLSTLWYLLEIILPNLKIYLCDKSRSYLPWTVACMHPVGSDFVMTMIDCIKMFVKLRGENNDWMNAKIIGRNTFKESYMKT